MFINVVMATYININQESAAGMYASIQCLRLVGPGDYIVGDITESLVADIHMKIPIPLLLKHKQHEFDPASLVPFTMEVI